MKNRYAYVAVTCLWAAVALGQAGQSSTDTSNAAAAVPPVVAVDAMGSQDAALLSSEHEALVRAAHFYDYDLGKGDWTVNQAVCPAAPAYLIVQMNEGTFPVQSFFTAVIPRKGGPVRIIPLLHRGIPSRWKFGEDELQRDYVAKVIPIGGTASGDAKADWMQVAGCYAALEGVTIDGTSERKSVVVQEEQGGAVREVVFAGTEPDGEPVTWRVQYGSHGKIAEMEATNEDLRSIPNTAMPQPQPVPNQQVGTEVRSIPTTAMPPSKPVPAPNPQMGTSLHSTSDATIPRPKPASAPGPATKAGATAIANKSIPRTKPVPAPNRHVETGSWTIPNTAAAQPKPVPTPSPSIKTGSRTIANTAIPRTKPVPGPNPHVDTGSRAIPNTAIAQPKPIPAPNTSIDTSSRTIATAVIPRGKPVQASNSSVEAHQVIANSAMPSAKPVPASNPSKGSKARAITKTDIAQSKPVPASEPQPENK